MLKPSKRRQVFTGVILFGLISASGAARATSADTHEIPQAYQGNWHESADEPCGDAGMGLMQVSGTEFSYPMSSSEIRLVTHLKRGSVKLSFTETSGAEGNKGAVQATEIWTLNDEGRRLTISPVKLAELRNGVTTLYRCGVNNSSDASPQTEI